MPPGSPVPAGLLGRPPALLLATHNAGKRREAEALLAGLGVEVATLRDLGDGAALPEPFATFHENARHKAVLAAHRHGRAALGEDSGLVVEALGGRPGAYSSRFAGAGRPDPERVALLLSLLDDRPAEEREARFVCALCLAAPDGSVVGEWCGECAGRIATVPRGEGGFGYDPVFVAQGQSRTNAELSPEEKNAVSHRGAAFRALREALVTWVGGAAAG